MDRLTETHFRAQNLQLLEEAVSLFQQSKHLSGERWNKATTYITMFTRAHLLMEQYLEGWRTTITKLQSIARENQILKHEIKLRDEKINELKKFMTNE